MRRYSEHAMARHLATYISDKSAISAHVSREFGARYTVADIERMLGRKATDSVPRGVRGGVWNGPAPVTPPLSTNRGGGDPLAKALHRYGMKYGIPGVADAETCREAWQGL